jgi:hypothetical protein
MAKKKRIGILGATALAVGAFLGSAQQANAISVDNSTPVQNQRIKDAKHEEVKIVKPQAEKNKFGGFSGVQNVYKHIRKDGRNQRQWRKWLRSNPNMRNSKKGK